MSDIGELSEPVNRKMKSELREIFQGHEPLHPEAAN